MRLPQNIALPLSLLCLLVTLCRSEEKKPLDEVKIDILKKVETCDRKVKRGDVLMVKYKGYLEDGHIFDDTDRHKQPFEFQIDGGTMIKGWQLGLKGGCQGEIRKLTIPPKYAFGEYGNPVGIPGNSVLIFEIEIVSISNGPEIPDTFSLIDANGDKQLSKEEVRIYFHHQDRQTGSTNHVISADLMFQYEDIDKNGFISHFEFNGPKHVEL